jgi:hypothetical protein
MIESAMSERFGLAAYREFGYLPGDQEGESVSKTLEYAYDDWCIGTMAGSLGREEDARIFLRRAQSYRNVFDAASGFMRPKGNGTWEERFDPFAVTFHYTEANPWQYSFFAPHDVAGLIDLMGGREPFVERLDSLFASPPLLTGRTQPDITGLIGQYAHGNEPSHHVAYLYNYAAEPWKTQRAVRIIMDSLYTSAPDGLCGNEDCGQMSAWYVMSALGLYQVCPGQPVYNLGSPLFEKATIHLENGRSFVIEARGNTMTNIYIDSAALNGRSFPKSSLTHEEIMNGGSLVMVMSDRPNYRRGIDANDVPPSPRGERIVSLPAAHASGSHFKDSLVVGLYCATDHVKIHFTTNGQEPTPDSPVYLEPLIIRKTTTLRAIAFTSDGTSSGCMTAVFVKYTPVGSMNLMSGYSSQYPAGGDDALIDGKRGAPDWKLGAWQGYEQVDLEVVIDLGTIRTIDSVTLSCLQDNNAWIFFPQSVEFSFSKDRLRYGNTLTIGNSVPPEEAKVMIKEFGGRLDDVRGRYIRVRAENMGLCPDWHKGAGDKAWLFVDEILVSARP